MTQSTGHQGSEPPLTSGTSGPSVRDQGLVRLCNRLYSKALLISGAQVKGTAKAACRSAVEFVMNRLMNFGVDVPIESQEERGTGLAGATDRAATRPFPGPPRGKCLVRCPNDPKKVYKNGVMNKLAGGGWGPGTH